MARIREVWAPNLEAEMRNIRDLIDRYPYVAMDTEFPGVVARPIGNFKTSSDYHYQTMRCNVDLLKIIQVGITLASPTGEFPPEGATWQFNFRFSLGEDMFTPESIEQLQRAGLDFQRHEEHGIAPNDFAELMITSGMVLSKETRWIGFHSGYDFGYFVKLLTAESLPTTEDAFFALLKIWFPHVYDIKFLMRASKSLKGGLQDVAEDLGVNRTTASQQAGADSLLTAATFFKMRSVYFADQIDDTEYAGKLYGLGPTFAQASASATAGLLLAGGGATIAEREDRGSVAGPSARGGGERDGGAGAGGGAGANGANGNTGAGGGAGMGGGAGGAGMGMAGMGMGMGMGAAMRENHALMRAEMGMRDGLGGTPGPNGAQQGGQGQGQGQQQQQGQQGQGQQGQQGMGLGMAPGYGMGGPPGYLRTMVGGR